MRPLFLPAFLALVLASLAHAADSRPNFLFVYTDDQRFDAMSVVQQEQGEKGRWPWLKTPNMDRLAREGVRFRNAFVVNSLCAPSRASLLTGCYGYVNGIVNNHTPFPVDNITYATQLRAAGYTTGFIGKWHMGSQSGKRPGFDYSASFIGQGRYDDCPFEIDGVSTPTKGWVDDRSADFALEFLQKNKEKPFCLAVAFKSTHGPCTPPERLASLYEGDQARTVPNLSIPAIYLNDPTYSTAQPTPPGLVNMHLDYMRCINGADENLGRLLDELDHLGLTENTIVIFSSDNGYYLGEHKLGDKRSAYEESMRVPLLLRYPKLAGKGKLIDTEVLNIDLAPTLLDYAGVAIPERMQGRSWKPLIEGKEKDWRRAFFYCYYYETNFKTPTMMAVRTGTDKLVKYPGHEEWTEMFDVKSDPYELKNLANNPDFTAMRSALEASYAEESKNIDFTLPANVDDPVKDMQPILRRPETVLDYRFGEEAEDGKAEDHSAYRHASTVTKAPLVEGRSGHKARHFDGTSSIALAKAATLSPASNLWTVEVTFAAEKPDGVVLAQGGASAGYALWLDHGKAAFSVRARPAAVTTVVSPAKLPEGWNTVSAHISADSKLSLSVNGQQVASVVLKDFIRKNPNDSLDIGADLGSQVLPEPEPPKFAGLIESVKIRTE
jgi:arylsulfatase A-like enzyme